MQSSKPDQDRRSPLVCLLAAPATSPAVLYGLYDVLASAGVVYGEMTTGEAGEPLLEVKIVAAGAEPFRCFGGVLVEPHAAIADVPATDVAIVCDVYTPIDVPAGERYPAEIEWLRRVHADGAVIASVCSGSLILAHSGLLDGLEATGHWAYRQLARQHYPRVRWREESVLARAGDGQRIVTAGGVTAWQDLALHLISRFCGPEHAARTAKVHLLAPHTDGQMPFAVLTPACPADRRGDRGMPDLARRPLCGGEPRLSHGFAHAAQPAHARPPVPGRHRLPTDGVCPRPAGRGGQADAGDADARRSTRWARPSATRIQPRSGGCSSASPASHRQAIAASSRASEPAQGSADLSRRQPGRAAAVDSRHRLQPDRRVVDHGTAVGRGGVGAQQQVDADALGQCRLGQMLSTTIVVSCWPGRALAWSTSEPRSLPRRTGSPSARPSWAMVSGFISAVGRCSRFTRGRHLGEGRVQELARRVRPPGGRACAGRRLVAGRHVVGQLRHQVAARAEARPVGLEAEAAVRRREAVQMMGLAEVGLDAPAAGGMDGLGVGPAGAAAADRRSAPTRSWRSRDARHPGARASSQMTKWLVRHSANGSRIGLWTWIVGWAPAW